MEEITAADDIVVSISGTRESDTWYQIDLMETNNKNIAIVALLLALVIAMWAFFARMV